jgi:hypothetical protein
MEACRAMGLIGQIGPMGDEAASFGLTAGADFRMVAFAAQLFV